MIAIKTKYQASFFGNFTDMVASTDVVSKILQLFKDKELLPGTFQELASVGPQTRIRLASTDDEWNILFGINRIDIIKHPTTLDGNNLGTIEGFAEDATIFLERIMKDFNKKGSRMSLITNGILKEMLEPQLNDIYLKLFKPIPLYKDNLPFQWNTRSVAEFKTDINGPERINVITALNRNKGRMMSQDKVLDFDRIEVEFDINTSQMNQDIRFNIDSIEKFFIKATEFRKNILDELEVFLGV